MKGEGGFLVVIQIGVCDDEENFRSKIKEVLHSILRSSSIEYRFYEFSSGEELLANYPERLDILIMDIQMKKLNGMDTTREIRVFDQRVEIIFMTSLLDFIQEGYEVKAYRYILKPINENKVLKHILPCINELLQKKSSYLTVNVKNSVHRIEIDSIIYIETQRTNIIIYTSENQYTIRMSLSQIEKSLNGYGFFRCHNSYLIHLKFVESIENHSVILKGQEIPISKYRVKGLKIAMTHALGDIVC